MPADRPTWLAPRLVLVAGLCFSIFLQFSIHDEVFFNGDAGVKAVVVRQFASGGWHADLRLPAEPWVVELWSAGLYPFGAPFVYDTGGKWYVQFPLAFPAVCAPFYSLFGFRGLYVVPVLSLWILWARFLALGERLRLGALPLALALAGLIFASHLTLYGAMYWEHTVNVLLLFCGLATLVDLSAGDSRLPRAVLGGLLLGLSVLFRPESVCFIVPALAVLPWVRAPAPHRLAFAAATSAGVVVFLAANYWLYGLVLGLHSVQTVELDQWHWERASALKIGRILFYQLAVFCPVVILCSTVGLAGLFWKRIRPDRLQVQLWVIAAVFCLSSLAILPATGGKQIGPRYWLPVVPAMWLIAVLQLRQLIAMAPRAVAAIGVILLTVTVAAGGWVNTVDGTKQISTDYDQRVLPALRFLRTRDERIVAVSHQWIAQELEATFDEKRFFRTKNEAQFMQLARRLQSEGVSSFLSLRFRPPATGVSREPGLTVRRQYLGPYGSYMVFRCTIDPAPTRE